MGCNPRLFHPHLCWRVRLHGPFLRNSGIINCSEISNLQNWTVVLFASRKNAFGPEGWAAIPACFIPICAGACACMGHSYETPELLIAQKSATCKIGPLYSSHLEKTPSALRDGLQSPPVSSPSVLARAPAWAIGQSVHPATIIGVKQIEFF